MTNVLVRVQDSFRQGVLFWGGAIYFALFQLRARPPTLNLGVLRGRPRPLLNPWHLEVSVGTRDPSKQLHGIVAFGSELSNSRAVFLMFRQNPLLLNSEPIEALRFNNLAIARGMDVLSNYIKHQFAHDLAQFTMLVAISVDENEIAPGFKQRSNVRDVTIEHLHVCIGQNQRIKCDLESENGH